MFVRLRTCSNSKDWLTTTMPRKRLGATYARPHGAKSKRIPSRRPKLLLRALSVNIANIVSAEQQCRLTSVRPQKKRRNPWKVVPSPIADHHLKSVQWRDQSKFPKCVFSVQEFDPRAPSDNVQFKSSPAVMRTPPQDNLMEPEVSIMRNKPTYPGTAIGDRVQICSHQSHNNPKQLRDEDTDSQVAAEEFATADLEFGLNSNACMSPQSQRGPVTANTQSRQQAKFDAKDVTKYLESLNISAARQLEVCCKLSRHVLGLFPHHSFGWLA